MPGPYSVWAVPSDATGAAASVHWGQAPGVQTGTENVVLRTGWRANAVAFLVGRVMGSGGEPVVPARIKLYPKQRHGWDHDHETVIDDAEGRFRIGPLPPDEYQINVSGAGHGWISLRRQLAEQTLDLGTLLLAAHGTVTVTVHRPEECKLEDLVLRLGDEQRFFSDKMFSVREDGTWHSTGWPPGRAQLEVWGPGVARVEQAVEVKSGAVTRVEVTLERATAVRFVFVQPAPRSASWTEHVKLTLGDARGVETPHWFQLDGDETCIWTRGLGAGRYAFAATLWQTLWQDGECKTEGSFVVPEGSSADARAPVEVRVVFPDRQPSHAPSGPGPLRR